MMAAAGHRTWRVSHSRGRLRLAAGRSGSRREPHPSRAGQANPGPHGGAMRRSHLLAAGCAAASALLLVAPTSASAAPKTPTPSVVASGLAAPFNVAINHGKVYVADGGLNLVGKVRKDGTIKTIVAGAIG